MRKPRSFHLGEPGFVHCYHVVSRVAGREILFGDEEREAFVGILQRQLAFSGLRTLTWCFMGNHFHLLLEVPDRETMLAGLSDEDILARLDVFRDEQATRMTLSDLRMWRENGHAEGVGKIAASVRERLFDLSAFMKELKLRMTLWYNRKHGRKGTLWEGRYKCSLVEDGEALRAVAAYIDLNPLRAGLAEDPLDYRWCAYTAAASGDETARKGIARAVFGTEDARKKGSRRPGWAKVVAEYRLLVYGAGEDRVGGVGPDGASKGKRGFSREEIREVWARGGKLPLAVALRCRVRYFTDGVALGSSAFVNRFFERRREHFGPRRETGARKMRGVEWGNLRCLRDLRVDAVG
jgi:putative transposase